MNAEDLPTDLMFEQSGNDVIAPNGFAVFTCKDLEAAHRLTSTLNLALTVSWTYERFEAFEA